MAPSGMLLLLMSLWHISIKRIVPKTCKYFSQSVTRSLPVVVRKPDIDAGGEKETSQKRIATENTKEWRWIKESVLVLQDNQNNLAIT